MKKIIILFTLIYSLQFFGQINCAKIQDKFIYIEFEIHKQDDYPIFMSGVSKNFNINEISTKSAEMFVENFYRDFFYVPNIERVSYKIVNSCKELDSPLDFGKQIFKTLKKIKRNSSSSSIKLDDGNIVKINICEMKGTFLIFDKKYLTEYSSSNEYLVDTIKKDCYLPFFVKCIRKR